MAIDWAQAEKKANDWVVERWREPIRWFFVTAKAQTAPCAEFTSGSEGESEGQSDCVVAVGVLKGTDKNVCVTVETVDAVAPVNELRRTQGALRMKLR